LANIAMNRNVVGIYIGNSHIEATVLKWHLGSWIPVTIKEIKSQSSIYEATRELVSRRSHLKKATVVVGLPHSSLFIGEIPHPNLTPDESREAIELNLGSYAHLEPKEIYFDISAYTRNGVTCSLLVYTQRRSVDPVLTALNRAGFLKAPIVTPAALGFDLMIRRHAKDLLPCLGAAVQGDYLLLSLHGRDAWHGCHHLLLEKAEADPFSVDEVIRRLPPPYNRMGNKLVVMDQETKKVLQDRHLAPSEKLSKAVRGWGGSESLPWSLCTAMVGTSFHPPLWLGTKLRSMPLLHRINKEYLAVGALAAVLAGVTAVHGMNGYYLSRKLHSLQNKTAKLHQRLAPLKKLADQAEELDRKYKEITNFTNSSPSPLSIMLVLARRMPTDTWIRNFDYRNDRVRITVEGGQAVEVIEKLKGIPAFLQVSLASPVTKFQGKERYTLEIKLRQRNS